MGQVRHAFASAKSDDPDNTLVQPGDWNADHVGILAVRKTANQGSTDTTLISDTDLKFAMAANEVWAFALFLQVLGPEASDIKIKMAGPAGVAGAWVGAGPRTDDLSHANWNSPAVGGASESFGTHPTVAQGIIIRGTVVNGANAGDLQLQFAQNVTGGTTSILTNSHLVAHRVA